MSTPHTHCFSGAPVEIRLKDGTRLTGKFHERKGRFVILKDGQQIPTRSIRFMKIIKGGSP